MTSRLPTDVWETVVRSMPIPSVDLVVETPDGIVLARRSNEPAKGEWFVPGGRIHKCEPIEDAVHRVAREELGLDVTIEARLGTYDHFYDVSDVDGTGKHYVAHGFLVSTAETQFALDDQHEAVRVFSERPPDVHEYVDAYLDAADVL